MHSLCSRKRYCFFCWLLGWFFFFCRFFCFSAAFVAPLDAPEYFLKERVIGSSVQHSPDEASHIGLPVRLPVRLRLKIELRACKSFDNCKPAAWA
jgi:hypothetical protein